MKLQLKRSNVLDNGKAKEPTPPYVEYGELCVNYNTSDPALFIKDSNDTIIRIAGRGAVGEGGNPSGPSLPGSGNSIGDVFFNTGDLTLYYWDGTQWVPIANQTNAADIFVGTFAEVDVEIPEAKRKNGLLLWETEEGNLFLWYIDADTSQWVVAVPGGGSGGGGGGGSNVSVLAVAPSNPEQGDLWYCTDDGRLYIYYQDVNTSQWVDASPDNLAEGFWERDNGILKPIVSGDDLDLGTGDLNANNIVAASNVQTTSLNGGPLAGLRNQIINGDFRVWQRGDISYGTTRRFTADRWQMNIMTAEPSDLRKVDNPIANAPFDYALQYTGNDLGTNGRLNTYVELPEAGKAGPFVAGSTWTLSFYIEDINSLNTVGVSFLDSSSSSANVVPFTKGPLQDLGNNRYAFEFTAPAVGATNEAVIVSFIPAVGVNKLVVTGVQLEPGPVATPFEHRPIGLELQLCQRYYQVCGAGFSGSTSTTAATQISFNGRFATTMRVTPTVILNPAEDTNSVYFVGLYQTSQSNVVDIADVTVSASALVQASDNGVYRARITSDKTLVHTTVYSLLADIFAANAEL